MADKTKHSGGVQPKDTKSLHDAWLSSSIKQTAYINVLGRQVPLDMRDLAEGCVGVSLWFDTPEHAIEYGGADEILKGRYSVTGLVPPDSDTTTDTSNKPKVADKSSI